MERRLAGVESTERRPTGRSGDHGGTTGRSAEDGQTGRSGDYGEMMGRSAEKSRSGDVYDIV